MYFIENTVPNLDESHTSAKDIQTRRRSSAGGRLTPTEGGRGAPPAHGRVTSAERGRLTAGVVIGVPGAARAEDALEVGRDSAPLLAAAARRQQVRVGRLARG